MLFKLFKILLYSLILKPLSFGTSCIQIIRIFTKIRQMLVDTTELSLDVEKIKKKIDNQGKNIELVFQYLDELLEKKDTKKEREKIGYKK